MVFGRFALLLVFRVGLFIVCEMTCCFNCLVGCVELGFGFGFWFCRFNFLEWFDDTLGVVLLWWIICVLMMFWVFIVVRCFAWFGLVVLILLVYWLSSLLAIAIWFGVCLILAWCLEFVWLVCRWFGLRLIRWSGLTLCFACLCLFVDYCFGFVWLTLIILWWVIVVYLSFIRIGMLLVFFVRWLIVEFCSVCWWVVCCIVVLTYGGVCWFVNCSLYCLLPFDFVFALGFVLGFEFVCLFVDVLICGWLVGWFNFGFRLFVFIVGYYFGLFVCLHLFACLFWVLLLVC